jgi:putative pyruvate formate lyase activating enzyme
VWSGECRVSTDCMYLSKCELCPRRCGVDRTSGKTGFCKAGEKTEIFRYGPHHGEEPPLSGTNGSGTIFFSRCTLQCLYCQNFPWSQEGKGDKYSVEELARIFEELRMQGCHNWNLVSPTPWLPMIGQALAAAKRSGEKLPLVYNTSGFERPEMLEEFKDVADVYLTDLRYSREESAHEGSGSPLYVKSARAALETMWKIAGPFKVNADGVAVSGTICRILVLPGRANEAVDNLRWMAEAVGTDISLSLMAQYLPLYKADPLESWNRRITLEEYTTVCDEAERLGFSEGWTQEFGGAAPSHLIGHEMKGVVGHR